MKNKETILIIGITGLLGGMAAKQFLRDGYSVKALVRNIDAAKDEFPKEIELVKGDITIKNSVKDAVKNVDFVHISVSGGNDPKNIFEVEYEGVKNVIEAAQKSSIKRVTHISGMSVNEENQSHPSEKAKLMAENEFKKSSVAYTIFKPGFFMETLERFVQKDKALLLGKQPNPMHLIAVNDLMSNISKCYHMSDTENKTFYVIGNKPILLKDALQAYVNKVHPTMKVKVMPLWAMKPINQLFMGGKLSRVIGIMEILERKGEEGNPQEYLDIFGKHPTTFEEWLNRLN